MSSYEGGGLIAEWDKFVSGTLSTGKTWYENGKNFILGIDKGAQNNLGILEDTGADMSNAVDKGVKDAAGIHSPARLMIENAGYMVDGLVVGFENSYPQINESMSNLVSEMSTAVQTNFHKETPNLAKAFSKTITEAAARAEALADGGTFTIRPVLDMSRVEEQLRDFSSKVSAATAREASSEITGSAEKVQNDGSSTTNITNNFNQTINTPKVASPIEVVRKTKNLMSQIIGEGKVVS